MKYGQYFFTLLLTMITFFVTSSSLNSAAIGDSGFVAPARKASITLPAPLLVAGKDALYSSTDAIDFVAEGSGASAATTGNALISMAEDDAGHYAVVTLNIAPIMAYCRTNKFKLGLKLKKYPDSAKVAVLVFPSFPDELKTDSAAEGDKAVLTEESATVLGTGLYSLHTNILKKDGAIILADIPTLTFKFDFPEISEAFFRLPRAGSARINIILRFPKA